MYASPSSFVPFSGLGHKLGGEAGGDESSCGEETVGVAFAEVLEHADSPIGAGNPPIVAADSPIAAADHEGYDSAADHEGYDSAASTQAPDWEDLESEMKTVAKLIDANDAQQDLGLVITSHISQLTHKYAVAVREELETLAQRIAVNLSAIESLMQDLPRIREVPVAVSETLAEFAAIVQEWGEAKKTSMKLLAPAASSSPQKRRRVVVEVEELD